jgi:hypothetical protein
MFGVTVAPLCDFQVLKIVDLNLVDNAVHITTQEKNQMLLNLVA